MDTEALMSDDATPAPSPSGVAIVAKTPSSSSVHSCSADQDHLTMAPPLINTIQHRHSYAYSSSSGSGSDNNSNNSVGFLGKQQNSPFSIKSLVSTSMNALGDLSIKSALALSYAIKVSGTMAACIHALTQTMMFSGIPVGTSPIHRTPWQRINSSSVTT